MEWIKVSLEKLSEFIRRHSVMFSDKEREISKDALLTTARLHAIIDEMRSREEYSFIEEEFLNDILIRVLWIYRQLLVDYRINYREYLKFEDDSNRFFDVSATGDVLINQKIYNIPKHIKDKGLYPDLATGMWIKEYELEE